MWWDVLCRWVLGSNLAGRGGDLIIIDDPHSEQTAMSNAGFDDAWDWYTGGGPSTATTAGRSIVLVQTRWSEKDMTGQLLRAMAKDPLRRISGRLWSCLLFLMMARRCWPEFWSH